MRTQNAVSVILLSAAAAALFGVAACGNGKTNIPIVAATPDVEAFRKAAVEVQNREPYDLDRVTVQYVQIPKGLYGNSESKPELSLEEAEAKAAELFKQALEGADFDRLVYVHSYGSLSQGQRPGVSTLVKGDLPKGLGPITFSREGMDDVDMWQAAWRLDPGEIGAVEWHRDNSPGGFYVIRRLSEAEIKKDNPANFDPPNQQVAKMRQDAADLMQRDEHSAERIKVQHFVIARYMSAPDGRHKILQPAEAEIKAAELYALALDGADFTGLVEANTYDALSGDPTGSYVLVTDDSELEGTKREGMIPAFGDAGWRLKVGEIGVVLYDQARSWYGYHIIKRLE